MDELNLYNVEVLNLNTGFRTLVFRHENVNSIDEIIDIIKDEYAKDGLKFDKKIDRITDVLTRGDNDWTCMTLTYDGFYVKDSKDENVFFVEKIIDEEDSGQISEEFKKIFPEIKCKKRPYIRVDNFRYLDTMYYRSGGHCEIFKYKENAEKYVEYCNKPSTVCTKYGIFEDGEKYDILQMERELHLNSAKGFTFEKRMIEWADKYCKKYE